MAQEVPPDLVATAMDYRGRTVYVAQSRLDHIAEEHPDVRHDDLIPAIQRADRRTRGNRPGVEKLWARTIIPKRNFVILVGYSGRTGMVLTAYTTRREPKEDDLI